MAPVNGRVSLLWAGLRGPILSLQRLAMASGACLRPREQALLLRIPDVLIEGDLPVHSAWCFIAIPRPADGVLLPAGWHDVWPGRGCSARTPAEATALS